MGGVVWNYPPGATPLDPDEANGLIPQHITTQGQLNEWEQVNILEAEKWLSWHRLEFEAIVSQHFIKKLHQQMFAKTWRWAGEYRRSNKNIGVDWPMISVQLQLLLDDLIYQVNHNSYAIDETAARFHHRLVAIHAFANGNGRHARMMTDIILLSQQQPRFTWGRQESLVQVSPIREHYIQALRAADKNNYAPLLNFVRS
ncbi:MAG: mobile mystery protein B [Legionellales bacterium]|nr:mobile mystery protein B [Legionellales bacterium]